MSHKVLALFVCVLIIVGAYIIYEELAVESDKTFDVSQIIDGDTIKLSNGERVRLIGINSPEKEQFYYSEATEKLRELIGDNQVTLKKDEEDKDQYGRLLRYVYVNKTFINLEMVKHGYAIAYTFEPNTKHSDELESAEQDAIIDHKGMWAASPYIITILEIHADAEGNDNENLNDEYVIFENHGSSIIDLTGWFAHDESNNPYIFPTFYLINGSSVTLYTGPGTDTENELYWGSDKPIWNNDGDTLYLRDSEGYFVTHFGY
jgi:micrococcal nuclease